MSDLTHPADSAPAATSKRDAAGETAAQVTKAKGSQVTAQAVTINKPVAEVYGYFRNFANLPTFMENVERIDVHDQKRSHWVVKAPGGATVEWDAVVTDEEPERFVAWTSEPGADVPNSGRVEFRDAGKRGTVVSATILYDPPAGFIGKLVAKVFQREPALQSRRDLNRFKQLMETGEIATSAMNRQQHDEGKNG
ncbi:SRPBCC family protein [Sphingomonas lenta]|uniref:Cyclase n=1 Tax=Sphingomonas lenta TaxID=1141887 RepID=A0A2A2SDL8_9SPHN|nr:SRPBCC family protein [Sphingomonas lenta]PAX07282.1 cyclase [Sphingomonas lenta]